MIRGNDAVEPGISQADDRRLLIVETIVAEDTGFGIVGGLNFGAAMDESVRLVKVHCCRHVFRDDSIVLPELGDAIDLHGQHHWDADAMQIAREEHHRRSAPAMTEQHDVRRGLFFFTKHAVLVGIKQAKDRFEGRLAMPVLEDLDVGIFGGIPLKTLRDLDGTVIRIVMADESADETDENIGWGLRIAGDSAFRRQQGGSCGCKQEEHAAKRTESTETKHAELLTNRMTQFRGGMR